MVLPTEIRRITLSQDDRAVEINGLLRLCFRNPTHFELIWFIATWMEREGPLQGCGATEDDIRKHVEDLPKALTQYWRNHIQVGHGTTKRVYTVLEVQSRQDVTDTKLCEGDVWFRWLSRVFPRTPVPSGLEIDPRSKLYSVAPSATRILVRGATGYSWETRLRGAKRCVNTSRKQKRTRDAISGRLQLIERRLRAYLKVQAKHHLAEKLHGKDHRLDYQPLEMEIGLTQTQCSATRAYVEHEKRDGLPDHNRSWHDFHPNTLCQPDGAYILTSDTGTGKTTFLRTVQLEMLRKKSLIPVYLHASRLERVEFHSTDHMLLRIPDLLGTELTEDHNASLVREISSKTVLLVDGLDQITGSGTAYRHLLDRLLHACPERLVIAARPFAVVSHEQDERVVFIRLKAFSDHAQRAYFGTHYRRACRLCTSCPELKTIPMLAFMIRTLIENGQDKDIETRTQLYDRFTNYVLYPHTGYDHENLVSDRDTADRVRQVMERTSYEALAHEEHFVQKIPMDLAASCAADTHTTVEQTLKHGLITTICERGGGVGEHLYFTHQSFQEYLAAGWVAREENRIKNVVTELWNSKWKEVIRFLAGIIGSDIIERLYSRETSDNCIHSRLFMAAECIGEIDHVPEIEEQVLCELKDLATTPLFGEDALVGISKLKSKTAIEYLLEIMENSLDQADEPWHDNRRMQVIQMLDEIGHRLDVNQRRRFLKCAFTSDELWVYGYEKPLGHMSKQMLFTHDDIGWVIDYICSNGIWTFSMALLLCHILPCVNQPHKSKLEQLINSADESISTTASLFLENLTREELRRASGVPIDVLTTGHTSENTGDKNRDVSAANETLPSKSHRKRKKYLSPKKIREHLKSEAPEDLRLAMDSLERMGNEDILPYLDGLIDVAISALLNPRPLAV